MQVHYSPSRRPLTRSHGTGLGLADFDFGSIMSSVGDTLTKIAPSLATVYTTKANIDSQQKMAQAQAQYAMTGGLFPGYGTAGMTGSLAQSPMMPMILLGGMGLLAFVMMSRRCDDVATLSFPGKTCAIGFGTNQRAQGITVRSDLEQIREHRDYLRVLRGGISCEISATLSRYPSWRGFFSSCWC
jgi:hypothetical protein